MRFQKLKNKKKKNILKHIKKCETIYYKFQIH